ncbi:MAG: mandelate racemase/muconate lactonizing enzyme family protein [Rhodospirillales bacterium]
MKITRIETIPLTFPHPKGHRWDKGGIMSHGWDQVIVRVHTDEGISGIGESYHLKAPETVVAAIENSLAPLVIGADPFDTDQLWTKMFARTIQLGAAAIGAIAGIDTAFWDIKGKVLGLPVYKLLGGAHTKEVPLYVGGHTLGWRDLDNMADLVAEARGYYEQGYRAFKLRGGRGYPKKGDVDSVRAMREAFGDGIEILIDVNSEYGEYTAAMRAIRQLDGYNVHWVEDPFRFSIPNNIEDMAKLSLNSPVPIATGGNVFGRVPVKRLMERGGIDYVLSNVAKSGGVTEVRKIITLVEAWNRKYVPHCDGGLNTLANIHLYASAPPHVVENAYMEWDPVWPLADLLTHPPAVKNGKALLPERPGFGSDLIAGVEKEFALDRTTWFIQKDLIHA